MDGNFENAMAGLPQPQDWLEDRKGKDDKMFWGM